MLAVAMPHVLLKISCSFLMLRYSIWGATFLSNISVEAGIPWKRFDLCTQILVATIAICYANTIVDVFL